MAENSDIHRQIYSGLDTGLRLIDIYGNSIIVPSTGEIGRSFIWESQSMLVLTNPLYDVRKKSVQKPLASRIHKNQGSLKILNVGCGGCSDMPLLEQILEETLLDDGIDPNISITNIDVSEKVVQAVKNGTHPYFLCRSPYNEKKDIEFAHEKKINEYLEKCFEKSSVVDTEEMIYPILGREEPVAIKTKRQSYLMKKEFAEKINVIKADASDLKEFENEDFDFIIAHNLFKYLQKPQKTKFELIRVLKNHGFLFPDHALYQCEDKKLSRVSGRISSLMGMPLIDEYAGGILPMLSVKDLFVPFSLEKQYFDKEAGETAFLNYDTFFAEQGHKGKKFFQIKNL